MRSLDPAGRTGFSEKALRRPLRERRAGYLPPHGEIRLLPGLEGELAQLLPTPAHFEQASSLVTEEMVGASMACGPDLDAHVAQLQAYVDAGYDEVFVQQIGPDQEGFFRVYESEVLPRLRG